MKREIYMEYVREEGKGSEACNLKKKSFEILKKDFAKSALKLVRRFS